MAGQLKLRRGTTSQLANYIGAQGELTYNTTLKSLVLHDGVTAGGVKIPYLSNNLVPSTMLPTATESVVGASKIATTAIAQEGVNDTDIMTAKKVKDQVSMGGRIHATAYISIVGTVVTILSSKNIASVVLRSTGVLKVTTMTNMDNLNFSIAATSSLLSGEAGSTGMFTEWLNTNGTNKRTLNSFELVSFGLQNLGNPRYFGVTVIC